MGSSKWSLDYVIVKFCTVRTLVVLCVVRSLERVFVASIHRSDICFRETILWFIGLLKTNLFWLLILGSLVWNSIHSFSLVSKFGHLVLFPTINFAETVAFLLN